MESLSWESVRDEFAFDGSWRDIYVLGTDMAAWQRMLDGLRSARYELAYFRYEDLSELPGRAEDAFPREGQCDRRLSARFCGVLANCHFFTPDHIEFDIDPREVKGQAQLDALIRFMACLAWSVGSDAILCAENCPDPVIIRVSPGGAVEYHAFGGWNDWR